MDAGDLGEPGHLVEREAAGELDPRGDGGAADALPGGHGAGHAGGAVGGREVPAALEEAEDGGGGSRRGRGRGGLVELGGGGLRRERGGEGRDARGRHPAREALVGAALVDERVDVGARRGRRRVERQNGDRQKEEPTWGDLSASSPCPRPSYSPSLLAPWSKKSFFAAKVSESESNLTSVPAGPATPPCSFRTRQLRMILFFLAFRNYKTNPRTLKV